MEEARWWVNVSTTRSQSDRITTTLSASAAVKGGADVANLLSSDLQGPKQTLAPVNADQLTQMLALTNAPVANQGLAIYVYIYIYAFLCLSNLSVFSIHSCTFQVTLALLVQQQPMATRLRAASVVQKPRLKPRQLRSLWSPRRWMSKWTRRAASLEVLLFVFPFGASSYSILFPLDWSESEAQI